MFSFEFVKKRLVYFEKRPKRRPVYRVIENMTVHELFKNTREDTPIQIIINNESSIFLLKSYVRGYHVYKDVWNATINDYSLHCKIEEKTSTILGLLPSYTTTAKKKRLLDTFQYIWQKFFTGFLPYRSAAYLQKSTESE